MFAASEITSDVKQTIDKVLEIVADVKLKKNPNIVIVENREPEESEEKDTEPEEPEDQELVISKYRDVNIKMGTKQRTYYVDRTGLVYKKKGVNMKLMGRLSDDETKILKC